MTLPDIQSDQAIARSKGPDRGTVLHPEDRPLLEPLQESTFQEALRRTVSNSPDAEQALYHRTSPANLPSIFKYGLFLSATNFTVYFAPPPRGLGESMHSVELVLRVPAALITGKTFHPQLGKGGGSAILPEALKEELRLLAGHEDSKDQHARTSLKPPEWRDAVRGAKNLLSEDSCGNLRHFPTTWIEIAATRAQNHSGPHRELLFKYLDALEANNGAPLEQNLPKLTFPVPPSPRPWWSTIARMIRLPF